VNLREGTRRLALLLGVMGAIAGGFASYVELQSVLNQRECHDRFERLAASEVVQQERTCRSLGYDSGCSQVKLPSDYTLDKPKQGKYTDADIAEPSQTDDFSDIAKPLPSKINAGGIGIINWNHGKAYAIESIETEDGQILYSTPAPNRWLYLFAAILPLLGFALPWGLIRAVEWVGAGFFTSTE
jgi:hypothetical protein